MIKIESVKTYAPSRLKKKGQSTATSAFDVGSSGDTEISSGVGTPQSAAEIASLSQLMQLQEVSERDQESRRAAVRGEAILESLERLQNEILTGQISKASLNHIVTVTDTLPARISDPNLKQVIAEIKQRAMIEITKIEMGR